MVSDSVEEATSTVGCRLQSFAAGREADPCGSGSSLSPTAGTFALEMDNRDARRVHALHGDVPPLFSPAPGLSKVSSLKLAPRPSSTPHGVVLAAYEHSAGQTPAGPRAAAVGAQYMSPERFATVDAVLGGYGLDIGEAFESAEAWVTQELADPEIRRIVRRDIGRAIDEAVMSLDNSPVPKTSEDSDPVFVVAERLSAATSLGPTLFTAKAMDLARSDPHFREQVRSGQWLPASSFNEAEQLFFWPDRKFFRHPLFLGQSQGAASGTRLLQQYSAHPELALFAGDGAGPRYLTNPEMPFSVEFLSEADQEIATKCLWTYLGTMTPHLAPYAGAVAGAATDIGDLAMEGDAHLAALKEANLVDGRCELDSGTVENVIAAASLIAAWFGAQALPKSLKIASVVAILERIRPGLGQRYRQEVESAVATSGGAEAIAVSDAPLGKPEPGGACFAAGTLVQASGAEVPIESVQVGDWVWSRSEETMSLALKQVTETFVHHDKPTLSLQLTDAQGATSALEVTQEHPFWVEGRGWVKAGSLTKGDRLTMLDLAEEDAHDGVLQVTSVAATGRKTTVFNFTVDEYHTYFVGKTPVWVHNKAQRVGDNSARDGSAVPFFRPFMSNGNRGFYQSDYSSLLWEHLHDQSWGRPLQETLSESPSALGDGTIDVFREVASVVAGDSAAPDMERWLTAPFVHWETWPGFRGQPPGPVLEAIQSARERYHSTVVDAHRSYRSGAIDDEEFSSAIMDASRSWAREVGPLISERPRIDRIGQPVVPIEDAFADLTAILTQHGSDNLPSRYEVWTCGTNMCPVIHDIETGWVFKQAKPHRGFDDSDRSHAVYDTVSSNTGLRRAGFPVPVTRFVTADHLWLAQRYRGGYGFLSYGDLSVEAQARADEEIARWVSEGIIALGRSRVDPGTQNFRFDNAGRVTSWFDPTIPGVHGANEP